MHGERHACARCRITPADPGRGPRPFRLPGDGEHFARPRPYDVTHLDATLKLDVAAHRIEAEVALTLAARAPEARAVVLDAVGFEGLSVTLNGEPLPFVYDGLRATLTLVRRRAETAVVVLRYSARPQRGMYFLTPEPTAPDRPTQVWTQCQDEDARHWLPCVDEPSMRMATSLTVLAPAGWTVVSNGTLDAPPSPAEAGLQRWRFTQRDPHPSYLLTLAAGTFATLDASLPGLPLRYFVDPGREADAARSLGRTPAMLEHFAGLLATPYPWVKYDQVVVHDYPFGGMENTGATTLTERCLLDARAALDATSDDLVAHELAHQWFGDLVTCRDWSHGWLNEGFATFFEVVEWERQRGPDEALYLLKDYAESYFAEDEGHYRRPIVCNTWSVPIDLFDRHLYEKGAWVLQMLRARLGAGTFWQAIQEYLRRHRGGPVETRDLVRALEDTSGDALGAFFDQWVYRAGHPDVELEARYDAAVESLFLTVKQTQKVDEVTGLFHFTLPVIVCTPEGEHRHTFEVTEAAHHAVLRCAPPSHLAIDPEATVLMRLTVKTPPRFTLQALRLDPRPSVRWRAARTLGKRSDFASIEALEAALTDPFFGVGVEAARALGEIRSPRAEAALRERLGVAHPKVRRAVARALGEFRTESAARSLGDALLKGDPSVLVEAELARALGRTMPPAPLQGPLFEALGRDAWRDLVRAAALEGLGALRDARHVALFCRYGARGQSDATRRAAVGALAELGDDNREVREFLELLLDEDDPMHTPEVLRALGRIHDRESIAAVARCARRSLDGRIRRVARETLRTLEAPTDEGELRRLRDDFERLRDETRSLREALARLDGSATTKAESPTKSVKKKAKAKAAPGGRTAGAAGGAKSPTARRTRGRS
ncbi:MAG: HEAT repeat domain-containing protein [Myxococcales bacterium]|nr:HEAT repeat domain-containing protein [Myxococcales bacterium]